MSPEKKYPTKSGNMDSVFVIFPTTGQEECLEDHPKTCFSDTVIHNHGNRKSCRIPGVVRLPNGRTSWRKKMEGDPNYLQHKREVPITISGQSCCKCFKVCVACRDKLVISSASSFKNLFLLGISTNTRRVYDKSSWIVPRKPKQPCCKEHKLNWTWDNTKFKQ